jgi:hypothetical protein
LLQRFSTERAPSGSAVDGVLATLEALAGGRVQTLLVTDDAGDDRIAWYGPDALCVEDPAAAAPGTVGPLRPGRLVDIAVRAALLTDADVHVVPAGQADVFGERIGALCRF